MVKISASLWSADLTNLASEIKRVEKYVDSFHFDVGDGSYIHKLLFFPDLIKSLRSKTNLPFEVHLMVDKPEKYVKLFMESANVLSFHPKSSKMTKGLIKEIKKYKIKVGIVVNVDEDIHDFKDIIDKVDKITFMGTGIGVKGKNFEKKILIKITKLRTYLKEIDKSDLIIEVDGGIREYSVPEIAKAGANSVVAGSLIFNENYKKISKWIHSL